MNSTLNSILLWQNLDQNNNKNDNNQQYNKQQHAVQDASVYMKAMIQLWVVSVMEPILISDVFSWKRLGPNCVLSTSRVGKCSLKTNGISGIIINPNPIMTIRISLTRDWKLCSWESLHQKLLVVKKCPIVWNLPLGYFQRYINPMFQYFLKVLLPSPHSTSS